ncbi:MULTISPECIES: LexA family transcriptional regulator [Acetobacter]|jgi:phage repressor protein C with HTH and peptisase S24 domain|uniref:Phage repressor protein C with HTH and peptisase S24 domain n=1 Tax=Acetobacter lovaniensis TaxID=104100 RepID=A0A841QGV6_9PROT|nr:LexA family transcriptional regulator [Acetobacter lovaniensis]MBB6457686.1 phage repressor protein C with HTH and peptisase S24 domain [Acetobacter lovaniensis]MCI1698182.1 peptidase [Acetobacter lovaniensis]MCI1794808.1 peptidase [Acetobacter lovaniensis]MCP1239957.1 peptidase [Acetobacter lovaniensis]NHN81969.1 peptidase [Acetobacter lovaniensis]
MGKITLNSDFGPDEKEAEVAERALRLQQAVQAAGGNTQVAIRAQMPLSTLSRYLSGRDMKATALVALANACNVSVEWLAKGHGTPNREMALSKLPNDQVTLDQNTLNVRYFDVDASAGFGRLDYYQEKPVFIPIFKAALEMAKCVAKDTIIMHASGDSMSPIINSGDAMVIDTRRTDQLFGIYVFVMHGAVFVKRLSARTDGTILVSSNNKNYPPEEVLMSSVRWGEPDSTDTMCIVGRVAMLMTTTL